jgi:catechol 2,3-dioxygenase-like lactoylglutathione lyase family enzyme
MKRIHIGLQVDDVAASARFYSTLFGAEPTVRKDDYAKWMLDDPRVNFSISTRCDTGDKVHFGIQVEESGQLGEVAQRLKDAGLAVQETPEVTCCYAHSDKAWSADPDGFPWETFFTHGLATVYGEETLSDVAVAEMAASSRGCCGGDATETVDAKAGSGCCG